jgi:hypothetical protein
MAATSLVLRNAVVQIQSALAAAKTITAISKASAAVVTATHDFSAGDYVLIQAVSGMTQINDRVVRVLSVSTTVSFVCEALVSTNFTTYVSGGTAKKITFGSSFDNITQFDLPDAAPDEIDVTAIHDDERQIVFGHASAQKGTLSLIANPLAAAVVEVQTADLAQERRAFLLTLASGQKALFNAYCSGGAGMSGGVGAAGTAQISLTLRNKPQWFAS